MRDLLIGQVAKLSGLPAPTIRYYESIGLLRPAERTASGYRHYPEETVADLHFIKKAQTLGFSLDEVGQILAISRSGQAPCSHVLSLAHKHLEALDERLREIQAFRNQLATEVTKWEERQTAINCKGLCRFILDAEPIVREESRAKPGPTRRQRASR